VVRRSIPQAQAEKGDVRLKVQPMTGESRKDVLLSPAMKARRLKQ